MRSESLENNCTEDEDCAGKYPVIEGKHVVPLPEPDMVNKALPVPLDQIVDGVELDHVEILHRQNLGRPEDGGHPEEKLQHHADNRSHVAKKQDDRRGYPGEAEEQHDGGEEVVENLDTVNGEGSPVHHEHDKDNDDEEGVEHKRREDLHYGEHTDAEVYLFQQK